MTNPLSATRWLFALVILLGSAGSLTAQEPPRRYTIWDIHLGQSVADIPASYVNYACGTNGGPPSLPLTGFAAFKKCKADPNGLHEVYFEYDDELEYRARALELPNEIRMYAGTTVFEFPIVASVLIDDVGLVRGERMVTDPRQHLGRDRLEFWELANFLSQRFGEDHWTCTDLPAEEGEKPAMSKFLKNRCEKIQSGRRLILDQWFFQKKGQQFVDPVTGKPQPEAFDSGTRLDMYDIRTAQPNPDAR